MCLHISFLMEIQQRELAPDCLLWPSQNIVSQPNNIHPGYHHRAILRSIRAPGSDSRRSSSVHSTSPCKYLEFPNLSSTYLQTVFSFTRKKPVMVQSCFALAWKEAKKLMIPFSIQSEAEGNISSADWSLDPAELASKFNPKTRMILVNTPHNPIGKVGVTALHA